MDNNPELPHDQLLPQLRSELVVTEQIYDGQPFWVLKDPISLRYFRFSREEYFIIDQLRRGVTLDELKDAHRERFQTDCLRNSDIAVFVKDLLAKNLLNSTQPDRDKVLYDISKRRKRGKWFGQFMNFLFFKIPLYDPDKLFGRMIGPIRFIWTWPFFIFYAGLMGLAFLLVVRRWGDFADAFNQMVGVSFFTLYNVFMVGLAFWLVKVLHEFGHGLTCKNYGGEVHEVGLLFLVFMPFFYCDITDSWTFPNKVNRLLASAGGIMAELFIASVAAIVWYFTGPGFINSFSFYLVIICSVSTVLFNANPLLKFDGYYIIMDVLEVPNLRQRASGFVRALLVRYVFGGQSNEMPEEHRFRYIFPVYAVAALMYRCFIVFAILFTVYGFLKRYHLTVLGQVLFVFSMVTMILLPLVRSGTMIARQRVDLGISNVRLLSLLAGLTIALGVVLFWPMQQEVTLNFILEPAKMHWLRSEVAGTLFWSDQIRQGARLSDQSDGALCSANLSNPELKFQRLALAAEIEQIATEIPYHRIREMAGRAEQLTETLATRRRELARLDEMIANLQVRTPFSGWVLTSDRDIRSIRDKYIHPGQPLFLLGDTSELEAKVWVPEKTLARIFKPSGELDQLCRLMLYAFPDQTFSGRIFSIGRDREENMGEFGEKLALSNKVGGEVITEYDHLTGQERPVEPAYEVVIKLDSWPGSARSYMSGRVRIDCGSSTLLEWGRDSFLRFISPDVRL